MILVAGGSGRLGTALVRDLAGAGERVRVLTREPARAAHLAGPGVEVVRGDVRDPDAVRAAVAGARVVVSAVHGFLGPGRVTPWSVDRDGNRNLVLAAADEGAAVVLLSVVGAAAAAPMSLFRAKHAAEQHLRSAGARWSVVRSAAFVETWAEVLSGPVVPGRGQNPITFVAVRDVAEVVREEVLAPGATGRVIEVCGPDDLTLNELAAAVRDRTGARAARHVPQLVLRLCAPVSRRSAAAVVMDTTDMVVDRSHPSVVVGPTGTDQALDDLLGPVGR